MVIGYVVMERLNGNKPATPEPKGGKMTATQLNNNKDLEFDLKKEEPSFFDSFFSSAKGQEQKAKEGAQPMERYLHLIICVWHRWAECLYESSHPKSFVCRLH